MKFQIRNTHRNLIPQKFPKFARSELDKNFYSSQQRAVEWKLFVNCQNPFNFSQKLRNYVCERVHAHTSPTRGQNFLPALHAVRACTTKICFPFRARKRLTERRARNPGGKQRRNEFVYLRFPARVGTRKQKENREGKKKKTWKKNHGKGNIGKLSLKFRDRDKSFWSQVLTKLEG